MAITKALFKNAAQSGDLPPLDEIMARVNRQLTADNPSEMFVTIFACLLDLETGIVTYSDGGHELPFRLRADGTGEVLPKEGGMALGFIADYPYTTAEIALTPGDALMLYSDGVNEAMNPAHQMFKVERITETLAGATAEAPAASVARSLLGAVRRFADSAPQSDDITILVVRWKGPQSLLAAHPTVTTLIKAAA
jgi:sigma-B regulation protein RsbU (phosphoserine phosphatase)